MYLFAGLVSAASTETGEGCVMTIAALIAILVFLAILLVVMLIVRIAVRELGGPDWLVHVVGLILLLVWLLYALQRFGIVVP